MKILIVLTSHDQLGDTGKKTGFWLDLVKGKRVSGFTNAEEQTVGLSAVVPFLLEDRLKERGGVYSSAVHWAPHVQVDSKLVTGQNPASSRPAAKELLTLLRSVSTRI